MPVGGPSVCQILKSDMLCEGRDVVAARMRWSAPRRSSRSDRNSSSAFAAVLFRLKVQMPAEIGQVGSEAPRRPGRHRDGPALLGHLRRVALRHRPGRGRVEDQRRAAGDQRPVVRGVVPGPDVVRQEARQPDQRTRWPAAAWRCRGRWACPSSSIDAGAVAAEQRADPVHRVGEGCPSAGRRARRPRGTSRPPSGRCPRSRSRRPGRARRSAGHIARMSMPGMLLQQVEADAGAACSGCRRPPGRARHAPSRLARYSAAGLIGPYLATSRPITSSTGSSSSGMGRRLPGREGEHVVAAARLRLGRDGRAGSGCRRR